MGGVDPSSPTHTGSPILQNLISYLLLQFGKIEWEEDLRTDNLKEGLRVDIVLDARVKLWVYGVRCEAHGVKNWNKSRWALSGFLE